MCCGIVEIDLMTSERRASALTPTASGATTCSNGEGGGLNMACDYGLLFSTYDLLHVPPSQYPLASSRKRLVQWWGVVESGREVIGSDRE